MNQLLFFVVTSGVLLASNVNAASPKYSKSTPIAAYPTGENGYRYYIDSTIAYATAVPKPTTTTTYAPAYSELESLLGSVSTTTWGNWDPDATTTATDSTDPYGQYSWSQLWSMTAITNFTRGIYSTTVSPTSVPTSSLILPPEDPVERAFANLGLKFPKDFVMGMAGSASQIEGAVADQGRTPSILEVMELDEGDPKNYVTNENYYLYKQDIARMAALGVEYYSFSIPWTRILPFIFPGTPVNQKGIDHYDDLINTVIEYGMKPIVTLNHYDTPAQFYKYDDDCDICYWPMMIGMERDDFIEIFVNYGKIVMTHFADRVPFWFIFNEPNIVAGNAQGVKNVIMATAALYDFYHDVLQGTGKVGIKYSFDWGFPADPNSQAHVDAADRYNDINIRLMADPLYLGKDWPETFKKTALRREPNATWTAEELASVKGRSDFLGVDPYVYTPCYPLEDDVTVEECFADSYNEWFPSCAVQTTQEADGWAQGYASESFVYISARHHRAMMNWLWEEWHLPIFITEFGFPEWDEGDKALQDQLYDLARSVYYRSFLTATLEANQIDGVEVVGALGWSFADNWEFGDYGQQFGMQFVNRTTQERIYKKSAFDFVNFIKDNREE